MNPKQFQDHVIAALAKLDTQMTSLLGNGQPGRISTLEDEMEDLKQARWTLGGWILGLTTAVSTAIHFLFKY